MLSRFTAFILSLCIALPMCWCCADTEKQPEMTGCCTMQQPEASEQAPAPPQDSHCPCASHEAARDLAAGPVKAPAPALKLLAAPVWLELPLETALLFPVEATIPRHSHGPPLASSRPVYQQHCALLL